MFRKYSIHLLDPLNTASTRQDANTTPTSNDSEHATSGERGGGWLSPRFEPEPDIGRWLTSSAKGGGDIFTAGLALADSGIRAGDEVLLEKDGKLVWESA